MGRRTVMGVRDGLGDPAEGLGRVEYTLRSTGVVGGATGMPGTGLETLGDVLDGLREPWGGPRLVGGPS